MNKSEIRSTLLLAGIYISRMLGLFLIFPTFSLLAQNIQGATTIKIGIALGIYGLAQALLQIPAGWLSDVIGRKKVMFIGLILFLLGSIVAALSNDINTIIAGRFLQGTGAISAVCLAYVGDTIRHENQPKAMMIIGISIGSSFMVALMLGAFISEHWGMTGLFSLTALLALMSMCFTYLLPEPSQQLAIFEFKELFRTIKNTSLLIVNAQVMVLHMLLAASFFLLPILINHYLPTLNLKTIYAIPLIITALLIAPIMRKRDNVSYRMPFFWITFVLSLLVFAYFPVFNSKSTLLMALTLFFCGFTLLETLLPVQLLQRASNSARGISSGIYAFFQFIGSFFGGILGAKCYVVFASNDTIQLSFYILVLPAIIMAVVSIFITKQQQKVPHGEQRN